MHQRHSPRMHSKEPVRNTTVQGTILQVHVVLVLHIQTAFCLQQRGANSVFFHFESNRILGHYLKYRIEQFLPRDASAEHGDATVSRLSVRPSVCNVQVP